ncbi:Aminodeoxychorismate lyase, partial [Coemansia sp. RSA 2607]
IAKDMPAGTQVLLYNKHNQITEGNIANVAVTVRDDDGELRLLTPPTSVGLLAGTMRAHLLETGVIVEGMVTVEQFCEAARNKWPVFCMNSVRGLYPVDVYL